jgi:adenosylhomocysteine nucleosidase
MIDEIPMLKEKFHAVAGDWESGAIAWVADRNRTRLIILRGVTDLVGIKGGEAYGNMEYFAKSSQKIMTSLLNSLPDWLKSAGIL